MNYIEENKLLSKRERGNDLEEDKLSNKRKRNHKEAKESVLQTGDIINLSHLLFTKDRDYLITCHHRNTNKLVKIKAKDLGGKFILLHFMHLDNYDFTWSWKAPVATLKDMYIKLHPKGDFQIVFVALRNNLAIPSETRQILGHIFSLMPPCPAIPLSDQTSIRRLERMFGIRDARHIGPLSFIIDPSGVVLQSHATPLLISYGAAAYPFTNERIKFLESEDSLLRTQPRSVEKLLSSPDRDYLINNKGNQVPLHNLDDKVVGLYFCPCLDGLRTTRKLEMVYHELSQKMEKFEIVLIYAHGWCEHEETCSLIDEDSFLHELKTMPWLALPFEDTNCIKKLQRLFQYPQGLDWPRPDARMVIIGPHGEFLEPLGTHILSTYGSPAYPFTLLSAVNLELERAKKVKPEMLWELDAVFTRSIGSHIRFSQFVGRKIIVLYETYETDKWVTTNTLRELKARYLEMKGTDDEFEVIHIFCDEKFSTRIKAPVPWLMHPPFDKNTFADKFMCSVFGNESGLLAFDADGSVVRVTAFPQFGDNRSFPFYHNGNMEDEVLLDVKEKIAGRLELVYGSDMRFDDYE
ncbi:putative nucleoredoxin 1 isoform X1 [Apium graveolens]|uniref:putative nucleoredoxin 1 isoform X1 n=1 Tax=Apium graveolens TaxID=4045 RepID=UPI003D7B5BC9